MDSNTSKKTLHERNIHKTGYDFPKLIRANPALKELLIKTPKGTTSIDFADPVSVLALNKALLLAYYNIQNWSILSHSLCPPIPGRADYIHHLADLLASENDGNIPTGNKINILDIGTGSSLIYPILGERIYGWNFVGTDIDETALNHAQSLIKTNRDLSKHITLQLQEDIKQIFKGIVRKEDRFNAVMCNPPFFKSREDNWGKTSKKFHNLHKNPEKLPVQNFGGHANELWCEGGERQFIRTMINESMLYKEQLGWITTLVSDKDNLKPLIANLEYNKASKIEIIRMEQGNKTMRILAWRW